MLAVERKNRIIEQLHENKRVVVSDLSKQFGVSGETIRRDLEKLDREGIVTKSYGGAVLTEEFSMEMPFGVRRRKNVPEKREMSLIAASFVEDGDHIILDASSTSIYIAKALKEAGRKDLTVITNSIEIGLEIADVQGWDVICSGGSMKQEYYALVGPRAVEGLSAFYAEKAFLSCKALDMRRGITEGSELLAQTKLAMLGSARTRYLVADSTKFGQIAFSKVSDVREVDCVITDSRPADAWMEFFGGLGIRCLYPGGERS